MNRLSSPSKFQIRVLDYGPIADAQIDLRPLTVFVGPSNTGKSYLAILIYTLHRFFNSDSSSPTQAESSLARYLFDRGYKSHIDVDVAEASQNLKTLSDWVAHLESIYSDGQRYTLPTSLGNLIRPLLELDSEKNELLRNDLARCFGAGDTEWLSRYGSTSGAQILLTYGAEASTQSIEEPLSIRFSLTGKKHRLPASVSGTLPLEISSDHARDLIGIFRLMFPYPADPSSDSGRAWMILAYRLASLIWASTVEPLDRTAYYLPAGRTGMMQTSQMVIASMINAAVSTGQRTDRTPPRLPGVVADFLVQLLNLGRIAPGMLVRYESQNYGADIEKSILGGAVEREDPDSASPFFFYSPEGSDINLPLIHASSMVSELAPVALYLRYLLNPGQVLIIEEPESHLHPGMQVEFVRQLARIVKSGIRVMVTTHSEWVLEELANLVRLSDLEEDKRLGSFEADPFLYPSDVGVWLFNKEASSSGSIVREIPLDVEDGNFASGYEEVALGTYNRWASISNLIARENAT